MSDSPSRAGFVASWLALLRRRWIVGAAVAAVVLAGVAAVLLLSSPVYRADARLRLGEPPPNSGVNPGTGFFGLLRLGGDPFANDMELLASRTLTEAVVADAALNAEVVAPRGWHRDSLFTSFRANDGTDEAAYELTWNTDGSVAVRMTAPRKDSLEWTGRVGDPLSFGGVTATPEPRRPGGPSSVMVETEPFGEAVRLTSGRLQLERTQRDANVVEIAFDHTDPEVAKQVVASVAARFVELRTMLHQRESSQTADSLRTVADGTLRELTAAELDMEQLQREGLLVDPGVQSEAFVERYSETVGQLEAARSELEGVSGLLVRADAAGSASEAWTELVAYPRFLQNQTIGELLTQLTALEAERAALAVRRTPGSREYQAVSDQIGFLDRSLRSVAENYRDALEEQVADLQRRVAAMDVALARVPAQMLAFGRRQRDVRLLSEVLVLTEQRLRQEELRQALTFANVQVIDPPALQFRPVWPRKKLGAAVGLLLAMTFGLLAMVVQERADRTLRRASAIQATLGAPVLAVAFRRPGSIPVMNDAEVQSVLRSVSGGPTAGRLAVASLRPDDAAEAVSRMLAANGGPAPARLLTEGGVAPDHPPADGSTDLVPSSGPTSAHAPEVVPLVVASPMDTLRAASEAAACGAPVVLVVVAGESDQDELARAADLLAHTGAEVAGAIVLCRKPHEVRSLWD